MKAIPEIKADPILAATELLEAIENPPTHVDQIHFLSRALDFYTFAVGTLPTLNIEPIESNDCDETVIDNLQRRQKIQLTFPQLGLYWQALDSTMKNGVDGKLAVGDAIDDLLDISKELREVDWFYQKHGKAEALAALSFRHHHHLYMHVFHLRVHLEELKRS